MNNVFDFCCPSVCWNRDLFSDWLVEWVNKSLREWQYSHAGAPTAYMFTESTLVALHNETQTQIHTLLQAGPLQPWNMWPRPSDTETCACRSVYVFVCLYVCVCACIWQTGSPSAQAPTIGSLSRHIKVCFSVCLLAVCRCYFSLSLFVSLSVCLCTNLSDFMTPATVIKKQYRCLKGDNSKRGLKSHVATMCPHSGLIVLRLFTNSWDDSRVVFSCWTSLHPE